jgi:hypothetical protein
MKKKLGESIGEVCNRKGCTGIIEEFDEENCTCYAKAPCPTCMGHNVVCPKCGWSEVDF